LNRLGRSLPPKKTWVVSAKPSLSEKYGSSKREETGTPSLYERGRVGSGSSGGLVGALAPHMPEKWNPKKAFQLEALLGAPSFWAEVETASGLPSGYQRAGRALPLRSERLRNQALVRAQEVPLLWQGQADWQVVDQLAECAHSSHGWVVETLSARLNPRQSVTSLAKAIETRGGVIKENCQVDDLGDLNAEHLVIAAGHNAKQFTTDFPEEFWSAVKGQSALLDVCLPQDMPMVFESGTYVVPHGQLGTAVGSTVEHNWVDPDGARASRGQDQRGMGWHSTKSSVA